MAHVPEASLNKALKDAADLVRVGSRYTHFKNPHVTYIVIGHGILEATEEVAVIYQAQHGDNITFIRSLSSWLKEAEHEGQRVPRFASA